MYFTRPALIRWLGIAAVIGIVIGIAIGMGIALFLLMNVLNMDIIMPGAPILNGGFTA